MIRKIFLAVFIFCTYMANAQTDSIIKYYDSFNNSVSKAKAKYIAYYINDDSIYRVFSYYLNSNKLAAKFSTLDTVPNKRLYRGIYYYENGNISDSIFYFDIEQMRYKYTYYENGNKKSIARYRNPTSIFQETFFYPNGMVQANLYRNSVLDEMNCISLDSNGNVMENYIFMQEAEFKGGRSGWISYLEKRLDRDLPTRNGAPAGKYSVVVEFLIGKDGSISEATALNDSGYGTKDEAVRIIKNSPKWKPSIFMNEPAKYRAKQPITFVVQ